MDKNGFRDNERIKQRPMSSRQKIILFTALALCFFIAFIATSVALEFSMRMPSHRGIFAANSTASDPEPMITEDLDSMITGDDEDTGEDDTLN